MNLLTFITPKGVYFDLILKKIRHIIKIYELSKEKKEKSFDPISVIILFREIY